VLSLYFTLLKFTVGRVTLTAFLYATTTFLHVYEGVTLLAITVGVAYSLLAQEAGDPPLGSRPRGLYNCRRSLLHLADGASPFFRLSVPSWRALNLPFSTLFIAYPLAWVLLGWGLADYWRNTI